MDMDGNTTMAIFETTKKAKKLIQREQIVLEMSKQTLQNMASLEAHCSEGIKPVAKVIAKIKICYPDKFEDLNLAKFNALIYAFKVSNEDYKRSMIAKYYYILGVGILQDLFVENFFETLE